MCDRKKEKDMIKFKDFLRDNKEKIYKIAEKNTAKNKDGIPVIAKDDPWHDEDEWDTHFKELTTVR